MALQFSVSVQSPQDLNAETISAWIELEGRAVEANAYLSPLFILPAIKYLDPNKKILIFLIEKKGIEDSELVGVGVFHECPFSINYPFRHLVAYKSIHSYLSGVLIDSDCSDLAIGAMFDYFNEHSRQWGTVLFEDVPGQGQLFTSMIDQSKVSANRWWSLKEASRAYLLISESGEDYVNNQLSSKKRGDLRRLRRRLAEKGKLEWRCLIGKEINLNHIDDFLILEHSGWKAENQSSLLTSEAETRFIIETVQNFAKVGRVLFSELRLDGKTIASTCNFISGNAIFAHKLGWDPAYSKFSPSILNLLSMTKNISIYCSDFEYFDSGTVEGSFMEKLWTGRRQLANGYFTFSRAANLLLSGTQFSKELLRKGSENVGRKGHK